MEYIKEKVFYKRESEYAVEAFYDVTDQFKELPAYIQSIAVCFDSYVRNEFIADDKFIEEKFKYFFNENTIEEGRIRCDTEKVLITFIDGFQLVSWNSECGGLNIIPPQKDE